MGADVLKEHTGLQKKHFTKEYHDLDSLFGQWSDSEFQKLVSGLIANFRKFRRKLTMPSGLLPQPGEILSAHRKRSNK